MHHKPCILHHAPCILHLFYRDPTEDTESPHPASSLDEDSSSSDGTAILLIVTNLSAFLRALAKADVVFDETYPNGQSFTDISVAYGIASATGPIPAFAAGRVYTLDGRMNSQGPPYGGIDFYESRYAEPDALLSDVFVHPQVHAHVHVHVHAH